MVLENSKLLEGFQTHFWYRTYMGYCLVNTLDTSVDKTYTYNEGFTEEFRNACRRYCRLCLKRKTRFLFSFLLINTKVDRKINIVASGCFLPI